MRKIVFISFSLFLVAVSNNLPAQIQEVELQCYPELKPIPQTEFEKLRSIPEIEVPAERGRNPEMPAVVDNSLKPYMRPLIAQVGLECGQASSIGNGFTYEIDWIRDLPADVAQNQYPTHFAYNFINNGSDAGVSFFETWEILKKCGTPNVEDYGGMAYGGPSRWISGYDNYYNAMLNRITEVRTIHAGTPEGIALLKGWVWDHLDGSSSGGLANFYSQYTSPPNVFPPGTPEAGKHVITEWGAYPNHAMTIVGYNDSIRWDYNNDGFYTNNLDINSDGLVDVKDWEIGGFKMANTYGSINGWGDHGYSYMMYKTLGDETESGGIWEHATSVVKVKADYSPKLTMKVTLKHTSRNKLRVTAGLSTDTTATEPDYVLGFPVFDFQGGDLYMQGGTSEEDKTIEFGLDLNPLLSFADSEQRAKYFLQVHENDPSNSNDGEIIAFSVISYEESIYETVCPDANIPVTNNEITRLSVIKSCSFSKPQVLNASLPPATLYQPYSCQLNASGGTPPYRWTIKKDYQRSDGTETFPMVNAHQVMLEDNNDGYAQLPLDFEFPFYGKNYDSISIYADGYLMFEDERYPWPYIITEKTMFTNTRSISPYACHPMIIDPSSGGGIWYESDDTSATFRWKTRIFDSSTTGLNFAVRIFSSGRIEIYYGQMITHDWVSRLAGVSDGAGFNYLYTAEPGEFNPLANSRVTLDPMPLPSELSLDENGLLSGIPEQVYQEAQITFAVTDNNNICSFATLPFTTEGMAISCTAEAGTDNVIEFGETAYLNVTLQNLTTAAVTGAQLTLGGENTYITLTDTQEYAGMIQPGESVTFSQAFAFDVSSSVPDSYPFLLTVSLEGSRQSWSREFEMEAYAPVMEISRIIVADNENGMLDPGETAAIKALLKNYGGALATGITAGLSTDDPYLTINNGSSALDSLLPGSTDTLYYNITVSELTPLGYPATATVDLHADKNFAATTPVVFMIGLIIEDFETGDFNRFDWTFSGNAPWVINSTDMWEGLNCARSGTIYDNGNSALQLSYIAAQDDSISFYRKVSSEDNYDFLRFSIDNQELNKWSGEEAWTRYIYAVEKGSHVFKWDYTKDYSLSNGSDAGWLDYIQLPAFADPVGMPGPQNDTCSLLLYPNPSGRSVYVDYTASETMHINIRLYAGNGQPLATVTDQVVTPGKYQFVLNPEGWAAGTYFCVLTTPGGRVIRPFIITKTRQ